MNVFNDFLIAHVNVGAPYILSIPLLLTATTPTIYRIIVSAEKNDSNRSKTKSHIAKDIAVMKVVSVIVTYIIPCLIILLSSKSTGQMLQYHGIDAVYTAILWHPLTKLLSNWPRIILQFTTSQTKQSKYSIRCAQYLQPFIDGGPLGYGCSKMIQVVVACILWKLVRGTLPPTISYTFIVVTTTVSSIQEITKIRNWIYVTIVIIILAGVSWIVTVVLSLWLQYTRSKGDSHAGLNKLLQPTYGRQLQLREHIQLAILALLNAICEECTSRGFWRHELEVTAGCTKFQSNLLQGTIFGIWHYFGIPNGWTGVGLTTLYGWIMGYLSDWIIATHAVLDGSEQISTGLLFPILTHSIADYYIFTVMARQPSKEKIKI